MISNGIKFIVLSWLILIAAVDTFAAEAKGYKIVLASFGSFDEAKGALEKLGSKIGDAEYALQKEYHFEIAARSSGKAYMLAVEPIETAANAERVLKQFQKYYPDGYINGYFGPTEGAVFLSKETQKTVVPTPDIISDTNKTVEENRTIATEPLVSPQISVVKKTVNDPRKEESKQTIWIIIGVLGAMVLGLVRWLLKNKKAVVTDRVFKEKYEEALQESESEDRVEMIESEAFSIVNEVEEVQNIQPKVFEPEPDIFYKLKKNMFFMTLMGELKSAADSKEDQRCHDLMDEVLRYQKNFRPSEMIASMQDLLQTKAYDQLSELINREMD